MKVKAKIVGEYKVYFEHILGHGMMGKVFLGQKTGTNTYIAVK
jgi:predicted Ser/Thr protein kinase